MGDDGDNPFDQIDNGMFNVKRFFENHDRQFIGFFVQELIVLTNEKCSLDWASSDVNERTKRQVALLSEVKDRICAIHPRIAWELDARLARKAMAAFKLKSMPDQALASWPIRPQQSEIVEGVVRDGAIVELRGIDQGGTLFVLPDGGFKGRIEAPQSGNDELKVGQQVRARITHIDLRTNNLSLVLHSQGDPLHKLQDGTRVTGRVTHVFDDHARVDLGGLFATLSGSEISWAQWQRPTRQLKVGKEEEVKIIGIDRATRGITVSLKRLEPDPLLKLKVGERITGTVFTISLDGSLCVNLGGIFGWLSTAELLYRTPNNPIKVGQDIQARIIKIDPDKRSIWLSQRLLTIEHRSTVARSDSWRLNSPRNPWRVHASFTAFRRGSDAGDIVKLNIFPKAVSAGFEPVVALGHSSAVMSVAFSSDCRTLASGSWDHTIKLWDIVSGRLLRTLIGHDDVVGSVAFLGDSQTLASGSWDSTIKLWDVSSGHRLRSLVGHGSPVLAITGSRDGQILASGYFDKTIKLWDVESGQELRTLNGHGDFVNAVAFSSDGRILASGSVDKTIKLWDVESGEEFRTLSGHGADVESVGFSLDDQILSSGAADKTIKLWDVASGEELRTLTGHAHSVWSVAFSPDGQTLVSGSRDKTIRLWDVVSGQVLRRLVGHSDWVNSVVLSPDGQKVASGSSDNAIKLWDPTSGEELPNLLGHGGKVYSVAFSGGIMASGSNDKTIKLWDVRSERELRTLTGHDHVVNAIAFSPDGRILASGSDDKTIKLWEVGSGQELRTLIGHDHVVNAVAFSPDGRILASGSDDRTIKLWDVGSGQESRTLIGHDHVVNAVAFSPDGRMLASGSDDKTIKLWDVGSEQELRTLIGHGHLVNAVAFSPDGRALASGSDDKTIKLWDVASGEELRTFTGHRRVVRSVALSPDGRTLASGSEEKTVKLWDLASGDELLTLVGHGHFVNALAFSSDGGTLASGSSDGTVILWSSHGDVIREHYSGTNDGTINARYIGMGTLGSIVLNGHGLPASVTGDEDAIYHFVKGGKVITVSEMRARGYDLLAPGRTRADLSQDSSSSAPF